MRLAVPALVLAQILLGFPAAFAQPAARPPDLDGLSFKAVSELRQDPTGPLLVNGREANPAEWTASFYGVYVKDGAEVNCTSTLVAPQVLIAAAHCFDRSPVVRIERGNRVYRGVCSRPPRGYPVQISLDIALCKMDERVPAAAYERVLADPRVIAPNVRILLTGFGCTRLEGRSDGKFRIGPSFVGRPPIQSGDDRHWIITLPVAATGGAFICPGDSGGGAYLEEPGVSRRHLIAVNSHYHTAGTGVSYLTAVSHSEVAAFMTDWAAANSVRICGMHPDAQNCR